MRRLLASAAIPLLLGVVGVAPIAHAQTCDPMAANYSQCIQNATQQALQQQQQTAQNTSNQNLQQVNQQNIANGVAQDNATPSPSAASTTSTAAQNTPTNAAEKLPTTNSSLLGDLMQYIMQLFAWLLGVAAITLDNTVYYTVVSMGHYVSGLTAVGVAWRILRDIGNIALIFGFLAVGIGVILDLNVYGSGTKMLPMLLLAAVLLNFSLFIGEAVIDVGNMFATEFYTQINGGNIATPTAVFSSDTIASEGISNKIMGQLGLQGIYNTARVNPSGVFHDNGPWILGFMGILLFMIAAFVMFSLAFILIFRFVALIMLLIVAPIGIVGIAVPQLKQYTSMWWGKLLSETLVAPAMLLMLYVALAVITDAQFLTGLNVSPDAWGKAIGNTDVSGLASVLLSFLIAMGLLLGVTMLSKTLGAAGSGAAMKWGGRLSGAGVMAASSAWIGRNTAGAFGYHVGRWTRSTRLGRTALGRSIASGLENKLGKASFDVRSSGSYKSLAKATGFDIGGAAKGGYKKEYEESVKAYQKGAEDSIKDRAQTAAEKAALKQANDARDASVKDLDAAVATKNAAAQQHAKENTAESKARLDEANKTLEEARKEAQRATKEAQQTKKDIDEAIKRDTRRRREEYATRLEKMWTYLTLGIKGASYREAARNIRKNAGKSKEEKENEALLKKIKDLADKAEKGDDENEEKKEKKEEAA